MKIVIILLTLGAALAPLAQPQQAAPDAGLDRALEDAASAEAAPEPSGLCLFGLGMIAIGAGWRRLDRSRQRQQ